MSLEAKIEALTAAVEALTAKMEGGAAPAKAAGKPAAGKPAGKPAAKKNAEITVDTVIDKFGNYLSEGSAAAKKKAKQVVKGIVEHFDAERISKIDPEQFGEAVKLLSQYQDGEDPLDLFDNDDDGDDDGMV